MKHTAFLTRTAAFLSFCLFVLAFQAKAGGDVFKVYLNNTLLFEQAIHGQFTLKQLQLDKANINDKLTFHFSHCGKIGNGRRISLQDDNGKTLREWKFADATGKQSGMVIPVKELLELKQDNVKFYYTATELTRAVMVASFHIADKTTSWVPGQSVLHLLC